MHEFPLLVLLVATMAHSVFAIECYSCESVFEDNCSEDNFDMGNHFRLDCDDLTPPRYMENEVDVMNSTACLKKIFIEDGERKVVRSCFFGHTNATLNSCTRDPTLDPVEDVLCEVCDNESFCNGGKQLTWAFSQHFGTTLTFIVTSKLLCYK